METEFGPLRLYVFRGQKAKESIQVDDEYTSDYSQHIDNTSTSAGVITSMGPDEGIDTNGNDQTRLVVALDAEWQESEGQAGGETQKRKILCLQAATRFRDGTRVVCLLYLRSRRRPSQGQFLQLLWGQWQRLGLVPALVYRPKPKPTSDSTDRKCCTAVKTQALLYLVGHYGIVDNTSFYNRRKIVQNADAVRRTIVSVQYPTSVYFYDRGRRRAKVTVFYRDTMLLSPSGSSLEMLGDALDFPKIQLPEGYKKSDMRQFLKEKPLQFEEYAATDALIALEWIFRNSWGREVPITLGGEGARLFRDHIMTARGWTIDEFDFHLRGLARKIVDTGEGKRIKKKEPRSNTTTLIARATESYYGGRNECILSGIHHGPWYDFDIAGAYPAAMSLIPDPDYDQPRITLLPGPLPREMIRPEMLLFAHVSFTFPDEIRYPCLPIKDSSGRGLIFPRSGETWAAAPELWLAQRWGAEITLLEPTEIIPTRNTFSLADGMRAMVQERERLKSRFGKKSIEQTRQKEMNNSVYGKLAQGLSGKRSYSPRADRTEEVGPSILTCAPLAALTTAWVRALVSAMMQSLHVAGYRVASVTTDGFLCDAHSLDGLTTWGIAEAFIDGRKRLGLDSNLWELKHAAQSLVMMKTRGGYGLGRVGDLPLPIARAGYKSSQEDTSEALARVYLERRGRVVTEEVRLPTMREYVRHEADGTGRIQRKELSLDYDFKRCPQKIWTETIVIQGQSYEHVSFDSVPWGSIDEFTNAREVIDQHHDTPLKSESDLKQALLRVERHTAVKSVGLRVNNNVAISGAVSVLRGLRAGGISAPWFDPDVTSGKTVLERVGAVFGVKLSTNDWKNAGRKERQKQGWSLIGFDREVAALELTEKT
ncbi:DNA polymerase [Acidithiobacillus caldus]|uniref:DNA polymerase n=1 Tax=Acidithiobacillus caldus TaxID=33059 RepID=UPI001C06C8F3|nr:DNA polymerase [Acidithiobacillus caldus]MBU2762214.1 hypothetical protein [Acidithiobacillus caldus]MBU2770035.1 hypothetical protein [Acidithiobacillus caldus]MBU2781980.1 hypothetical protein [Acidithiobacillus caldus]